MAFEGPKPAASKWTNFPAASAATSYVNTPAMSKSKLSPCSERMAPLLVSLLNRVMVPSIPFPLFRHVGAGQATEPIRDLGIASTACVHGATGLAGNRLAREVPSRF